MNKSCVKHFAFIDNQINISHGFVKGPTSIVLSIKEKNKLAGHL